MFHHLLLPTDGSPLAHKGIKQGVRLAKALGAKATLLYVAMPYLPPVYGDMTVALPVITPEEHRKAVAAGARKILDAAQKECARAGVRCTTHVENDMQPWHGILAAARKRKCDAIVMATHGRSGLGGVLLGSQTSRVLSHAKIPVLATR
jgi:nucleotide-binding universal stress UspA family protein